MILLAILGPLGLGWMPGEKAKRVRWAVKRQLLILSGRLVDVGGHRLRIECEGTGRPTVVMDAGLARAAIPSKSPGLSWSIRPTRTNTRVTPRSNYERVDLLSSAEEVRIARPLPRVPPIVVVARPD